MDEQRTVVWNAVWAANRAAERAWADYDAALLRAQLAEDAYYIARQEAERLEHARMAAGITLQRARKMTSGGRRTA